MTYRSKAHVQRAPDGRQLKMKTDTGVTQSNARKQLMGLEGGRGIAALMVLLCHCAIHCRKAYGEIPWLRTFTFGHAGVDFFFVLSGFIMFNTHWRDLGLRTSIPRYLMRRIFRIYPLYWVVLAATLVVATVSPRPFPGPEHIVVSLLLSPTVGGIIVGDAWTLQHEMLFYAVFTVILFNKHLGLVAFAAWLTFLTFCTQFPGAWQSGLLSKLSSYFNFEFFLGIGAAWLVVKRPVPAPQLLAIIGCAAFLTVGALEDLGIIVNLSIFTHAGYGVSAMLAVIGVVAWERRSGLYVPPILARLGAASYAIYLVHILVMGIVWQGLQLTGLASTFNPALVFVILVVVASSAGMLASTYIEKPLATFFQGFISTKSRGSEGGRAGRKTSAGFVDLAEENMRSGRYRQRESELP